MNKYVLFVDNDNYYGPMNMVLMNVLKFDKDAENKSEQLSEIMEHIGKRNIAITELDGMVVKCDLVIESVNIKEGEEPMITVGPPRSNW